MPPTTPAPVIVRRSDEAEVATLTIPASGIDLDAVERALIVFALQSEAGNRTRAARLLRLTRSALLYRMRKYGLTEDTGEDPVPQMRDFS